MTDKTKDAAGAPPFKMEVDAPEMWKRIVKVTVDPDYFDQKYAGELREARRGHVRPGFRKGKVPMAMVEKELGPQVRFQTVEKVIPEAYQVALAEHGFSPVSDPEFDNLKMDEGEPVTVDITVEVRPEIEPEGYDDLPLTARDAEVADQDVDEALKRLRESRAVVEKVERPAALGDVLKTVIAPLDDAGEPDKAKEIKDYPLELGVEGNFAAFDEGLKGAVAGDVRDVEVTYPDDYGAEDLKGRTVTYRIEVQEVSQRTLPELDDAFAATIKQGQTLLELRQAVRADLEAEQERRVESETRDEILDLLIERNPVDLPPSLVENYLDSTIEEMKRRNQYMGRETSAEDEAKYREIGRPSAEKALRGMLLLEAIQKAEKIEPEAEEIEEQIIETATANHFDPEQYKAYLMQGNNMSRVVHEIVEKKAYDFLKSRAVFSEKKDKEAEKAAD